MLVIVFGKRGLEAFNVSAVEMEENYAKIISLAEKSVSNSPMVHLS